MKRMLVSVLIVVMLFTMFLDGEGGSRVLAADKPNEFDALRLKWKTIMTGGTDYDPADEYIATRIADIDAEAQEYWGTMEKAADRTYLWSDASEVITTSAQKTTSYTRLSKMALAYATKGSALEGNAQLSADIVNGLDWLYEHAYNENMTMPGRTGNWWDWEIGTPMKLNDAVVLMYDDLDAEQIDHYMKTIEKFVNPKWKQSYTGANRAWVASVIGLMGVFQNNSERIEEARDSLSELFLYVTKDDGFYEDGSFIQHQTVPYNGGYGLANLSYASKLTNWLNGSEWEVTDPNLANVIDWVYQSFEPFMHKGLMMDMVRGREISRDYQTDHSAGGGVITAVMEVAQFAPEQDAMAFRSMVKSWIRQNSYWDYFRHATLPSIVFAKAIMDDPDIPERSHPEVYRQFASMDRAVQVRPDYTFGLSMSSDRISTHEAVNLENMRGWYISEGMTYLYNNDISQYTDDFWPTVNPYRLPGTTVDTQTRNSGALYKDPLREAGGVEQGAYGTSAMKVKAYSSSMVAKKSWFNFDDEIVALGAGITSTDDRTIETTIENRKLAGAGDQTLTVNGETQSSEIGWEETMEDVHSIHLAGNVAGSDIGYYFPGGAEVNGLREMRTGAWRDIDHRETAPTDLISRPYMTLWFDHGINPTDGTYEYVLLPNKTAEETSAYAANSHIEILENTPEAQAVRENRLNITGIQFWNDEVKKVDGITSNKRAAVMMRETEGELTLSVSDPSQKNTGTIELEIEKSATAIESLDLGVTVTQLSPTIKLSVNTVESLGKTYHANFRLSPVTALPETPANFNAEIGRYGEVQLTWDIASQVAGYRVNYGTSSGGLTESVDVGVSTSYVPIGLELGKPYYFTVTAYNGLGESEASEEQEMMQTFIVVDNDSPKVTATGEWTSSTNTGTNLGYIGAYFGLDYWHDRSAIPEAKSVRYTPDLQAGTYKVSVWWLEHSNRSTVVPVEISHAGDRNSAVLNQRTPGSGWHDLGTYVFAGGSLEYVMISNEGADGIVVADAVKFEHVSISVPEIESATPGSGTIELKWQPADNATGYIVKYGTASGDYSHTVEIGAVTNYTLTGLRNGTPYYVTVSAQTAGGETPESTEIIAIPLFEKIMDDADSEGVTLIGDWDLGKEDITTYGSTYLHDQNSGKGAKRVEFTPELPAGNYKVYVWWVAYSNRATNVPITIEHAGITTELTVKQTTNGGRWNGLGRFEFNGDASEKLTISNTGTNGHVVVDAIRFVQVLAEIPEITEIVPGNSSATVHWTPIYNAAGYVIKYGAASGDYSEIIGVSSNVSSYRLPELTNGTTYYVTVSVIGADGGSHAAEVSVVPQDTEPPSAPSNVRATVLSDTVVSLSWDASIDDTDVAGYKVYRDGSEIVSVTDAVYKDSGLSPSTTYVYAVAAYDAAGNVSEWSDPASVATMAEEPEGDAEPPSVPGNVKAKALSASSISVGWDASTDNVGVEGYKVYRDSKEIATVSDSVYADRGLSPSTTYVYTVVAYDATGNVSEQSDSVSVTTLAEEPEPTPQPGGPILPPVEPAPAEHTVNLSDGVPTITIDKYKLLEDLLDLDSYTLEMNLAALSGIDSDIRKLETPLDALQLLGEHGKDLVIHNEDIRIVVSSTIHATEDLSDPLIITFRKEGNPITSLGLSLRSAAFSFTLESGDQLVSLDDPIQAFLDTGTVRNDSKLAVYAYDAATEEWTFVGGAYDIETSTMSFAAEPDVTYAVLEYSNPFKDIASVSWAHDAIDELTMKGFIKGTAEGIFNPGRAITRAEFVTLMNRLLNLDEVEDSGQFADVETGAWYANAIATAYAAGIMEGDGELMHPQATITREEMAVIIMRVAAITQIGHLSAPSVISMETPFTDDDVISSWAQAAVENVAELGIMQGRSLNRFEPESSATRAEAAVVMHRMINLIGLL